MEVSGQIQDAATLLPEKSPWYPLDRRLGGSQSRSERGGEERNSQLLPGLEPPIIEPVLFLVSLYPHSFMIPSFILPPFFFLIFIFPSFVF
jgi:hypothetical protein